MNILMSSRKAKFTIGKLLAILSILICANFLGGCTSHSSSEHQYSSNDSYSHDDFDDEEERDDVDDDSGGDDSSDAIIFTPNSKNILQFTGIIFLSLSFINFKFEAVVTE